jgi:regulation of enolase protein 1 (concanavalin A-like superfamily)
VQREPVRPAPAPIEQQAPKLAVETVLPGWGTAIDPDGDCTFTPNGKVLTFKVPGTPHDLTAERGRINAPRVLQELEGDFSFLAKVCGPIRPGPVGTVQGSVPFQSGGLLVWTDQQNYIRLERAAMNRNGTVQMSVTMETRSNGRVQMNGNLDLPEQEVYLRIRRAGGQILGAVSRDGQQWRNVGTVNAPFPAKIQAGLSAVNAAQQPLAVRFEEFQVRRGAVTGS